MTPDETVRTQDRVPSGPVAAARSSRERPRPSSPPPPSSPSTRTRPSRDPVGLDAGWSDDFTGAANTLPSSSQLDHRHRHAATRAAPPTGAPARSRTTPTAPANLSQDGAGNLRITPIRNGTGSWTSARIETQRTNFKAPAGGVLRIEGRIQMPNVTGAAGARLLARVLGARRAVPGQLLELAGHRRVRHHGERQRDQLRLGRAALRRQPRRAVQRDQRPRRQPGLPRLAAASRRSTPTASSGTAASSPKQLRWYVDGQQFHTVSQSQVGAAPGRNMTSHAGYFILLNVAMGGAFPNGVAGAGTPTGEHRLRACRCWSTTWRSGPGRRRHADPRRPDAAADSPPGGGNRDAYGTIQAESLQRAATACVRLRRRPEHRLHRATATGSATTASTSARPRRATSSPGSPPAPAGGVSGLVEVRIDSPTATRRSAASPSPTPAAGRAWRKVPGNVERGDRHAHGLPDLHQRPAGRLRQRQLVHLPQVAHRTRQPRWTRPPGLSAARRRSASHGAPRVSRTLRRNAPQPSGRPPPDEGNRRATTACCLDAHRDRDLRGSDPRSGQRRRHLEPREHRPHRRPGRRQRGHLAARWPGVYFEGRFRGTGVGIVLDDTAGDYDISIDGGAATTLVTPGRTRTGSGAVDGEHTVRVVKRSEGRGRRARSAGSSPRRGGRSCPRRPTRDLQLEFIGDSYTAGYGNTSTSRDCTGDQVNRTTNADLTFGAVAARALGADYQINAFSGRGMVRNYGGGEPGTSYRTYEDRALLVRRRPWDPPGGLDPRRRRRRARHQRLLDARRPDEQWTTPPRCARRGSPRTTGSSTPCARGTGPTRPRGERDPVGRHRPGGPRAAVVREEQGRRRQPRRVLVLRQRGPRLPRLPLAPVGRRRQGDRRPAHQLPHDAPPRRRADPDPDTDRHPHADTHADGHPDTQPTVTPTPTPTSASNGCTASSRSAARGPAATRPRSRSPRSPRQPVEDDVHAAHGRGAHAAWSTDVTTSGQQLTFANVAWNGTLATGRTTAFGFLGTGTPPGNGTLPCSAT